MSSQGTYSFKNNKSVVFLIKNIILHLTRKRKFQLLLIFVFILASGFGEIFSIASIVPLLSAFSSPDKLWDFELIRRISIAFGFITPSQLFIPLTILFCLANILSSLIRLFGIWLFERFAASFGTELSTKAFRNVLYQEYSKHLLMNSSNLITANTTHLAQFITVVSSLLRFTTSSISVIFILSTILVVSPITGVVSITFFASIYFFISLLVRKRLSENGSIVAKKNIEQVEIIQEALGSIIDVILSGSYKFYLDKFKLIDSNMRHRTFQNRFLIFFPRYILESISFLIFAFIGLFFTLSRNDPTQALNILGVFVLSTQKILPLLQQSFNSFSSVKAQSPSAFNFLSLLNLKIYKKRLLDKSSNFVFKRSIQIKDISFNYDSFSKNKINTLSNISFTIRQGQCIGVIGSTGSGKTTLINILLGMLKPSSGKLLIDDQDIYSVDYPADLSQWQKKISYVPQSIFLSNTSIKENIAIGLNSNNIESDRINWVSDIANISDFINSLPNKYDTKVGENGSWLSEGQKQRIGIARALYKRSSLLVLDEATSSLDYKTERSIMSSISSNQQSLTIIMIAHRLPSLTNCDFIIELNNGTLKRLIYPDDYDKVLFQDITK